jgi:hypothetical protein
MMAGARHIARKDLRQHRLWIAAYLAVVVLRAVLVGSGVDAVIRDQGVLVSLGMAYMVLSVLHLALLVTTAVQLVQGDRLVGTTAFWLTRPVSRGALLASKLGLAFALLVAVPVVLDGLVVVASGLAPLDVLGAVTEGVAVRLAVVLPIVALSAVTGDLAVFVVAAIAMMFGTLAIQLTLQWLHLVAWKSGDLEDSLIVLAVSAAVAGSLAALAHQVFTRRTRRTVLIIVACIVLAVSAMNRLEWPFLTVSRSLEPGWIDPARVSVVLTAAPAARLPGPLNAERPWQLMARYEVEGSTPNVVLRPFGFRTTVTLADGQLEHTDAVQQLGWEVRGLGSRLVRKDLVEHLLGDVQLLDAQNVTDGVPERAIAKLTPGAYRIYSERGGRVQADVTLGALAYQACRELPLAAGARSSCGDRQILMLSSDYRDGQCLVSLRDVVADFTLDLRRRSTVTYVLVNRVMHQALAVGARDYFGSYAVFGRAASLLLTEHVATTRRNLVFEFPKDVPGQLGRDWLKDAVIVPLQIRDIGQFTVTTRVHE